MKSESDCELPRPDLKKTEMMSSSGGSLADCWEKLRLQMKLVRSALKGSSPGPQLDSQLRTLLLDCLALYNNCTSSEIHSDEDATSDKRAGEYSPSLQAAFIWLGGWRPTSALVLVYSVLGGEIQGKPSSPAALQALTSVLSDEQLSTMTNLQKHALKAEHELSSQFAIFQMLAADQIMVKALVSKEASSEGNYSEALKVMESKIKSLRELLKRADNLRLQTLEELFDLLTPIQSAKCSIAAFELVFAIKSLSTNRFQDTLSMHQKPQSASGYVSEVSGKTTFNVLLQGANLQDPNCPSSTVGDNILSSFNTSLESLHFQDAGDL